MKINYSDIYFPCLPTITSYKLLIWPTHLIILDFIALIISVKHKSWRSPCSSCFVSRSSPIFFPKTVLKTTVKILHSYKTESIKWTCHSSCYYTKRHLPHRGHNTVNKNGGKQRQHPREDTHIHNVEQDQPQGMKNRETTKYSKS